MVHVGARVTVQQVHFSNDLGGTEMADGPFFVEVTKSWHDYETGQRFIGKLLEQKDIVELGVRAITGYKDEFVGRGKQLVERRSPALPAVFFGEFDIMKGVKQHGN